MRTKLYRVWDSMKQRCNNPNRKDYDRYGKRGINYCEEWEKFRNFKEWAQNNGYGEGLTLDRIDNDKGYSPDNCRWVTHKMQNNNKRNNVYVTIKGRTQTLAQWAEEFGVNYKTVYSRIHRSHWDIVSALMVGVKGG